MGRQAKARTRGQPHNCCSRVTTRSNKVGAVIAQETMRVAARVRPVLQARSNTAAQIIIVIGVWVQISVVSVIEAREFASDALGVRSAVPQT